MIDLANIIGKNNEEKNTWTLGWVDQPGAVWYYKLPCSSYILLFRAWGEDCGFYFGQSSSLGIPHILETLKESKHQAITMSVGNLREISNAAMAAIDMVKGGSL